MYAGLPRDSAIGPVQRAGRGGLGAQSGVPSPQPRIVYVGVFAHPFSIPIASWESCMLGLRCYHA
jgi:hypothetical protein